MITIGGIEYELLLTTKATKAIAKRYGGLANLGDNNYAKQYVVTGIKTVPASQLAQTEGPLRALGFTVTRKAK